MDTLLSQTVLERIKQMAHDFLPEVVVIRRLLHEHPELSFEEKMTADIISSVLNKHHIPFTENWAGYGIVAHIHVDDKYPTVAIRADMDALPIQEMNNVPYKSRHEGIMHACGHDVHTACVLGASIILNQLRAQLRHNIKIIFQPGEEKLPGGASLMIQEGVLENPIPQAIWGQHVYPELRSGKVGIRPGLYMASTDEIYISVKGRGGHAAMPHKCIDPVYISAEVITSLQSIVSRRSRVSIPTVLSIGKIQSVGGATNVIPDEVMLEGTFRTMDEGWREEAHKLISQTVGNICEAHGATAVVRIEKGYPSLINHPALTEKTKNRMQEYLGADNVVDLDIRMTGEDFAFYSQNIPACFYRLGTSSESSATQHSVHTPFFDIDENALETGMGLMAFLAFTGVVD
jgi:amidohydrolase